MKTKSKIELSYIETDIKDQFVVHMNNERKSPIYFVFKGYVDKKWHILYHSSRAFVATYDNLSEVKSFLEKKINELWSLR